MGKSAAQIGGRLCAKNFGQNFIPFLTHNDFQLLAILHVGTLNEFLFMNFRLTLRVTCQISLSSIRRGGKGGNARKGLGRSGLPGMIKHVSTQRQVVRD